ncbi:MAG: hypothetical protein ACPG7F_01745 [Aggregatilineales bacterium]
MAGMKRSRWQGIKIAAGQPQAVAPVVTNNNLTTTSGDTLTTTSGQNLEKVS